MKDSLQKIAVGIIIAVFSAYIGWVVAFQRLPNVQLVIDRPLELDADRVTVFRLENYGGGVGNGVELRFNAKIALSDIKLITKFPQTSVSGAPVMLSIQKLKPKDPVIFYIREPKSTLSAARELIDSVVYDDGKTIVSTYDERLESYVSQKRRDAFLVGFSSGAFSLLLVTAIFMWREKRAKNRALVSGAT